MKNILAFLIIFLFFSCENSIQQDVRKNSSENTIDTLNITKEIEPVEKEDVLIAENVEHIGFNILYDLPQEWTMITATDSGNIIYNPCFEQNPQIKIQYPDYQNDKFVLIVEYAQDGQSFILSEIDIISSGNINFKDEYGVTISFVWEDRNNGLAKWSVAEFFNSSFVDKKHLSNYQIFDEECDEEY